MIREARRGWRSVDGAGDFDELLSLFCVCGGFGTDARGGGVCTTPI